MNYKKYIAIKVSSYLNLSIERIENSIVTPSDIKNGDYSLLCFKLNEKLRYAPLTSIFSKIVSFNFNFK